MWTTRSDVGAASTRLMSSSPTRTGTWTTARRRCAGRCVAPVQVQPVAESSALWLRRAATSDPLLAAASRQGFVLGAAQLRRLDISREASRSRSGATCRSVPDEDSSHLSRFPATRRSRGDNGMRSPRPPARACAVTKWSARAAARYFSACRHFRCRPCLASRRDASPGPTSDVARTCPWPGYRPRTTTTWFGVAHTTAARTLVDLARPTGVMRSWPPTRRFTRHRG